MGGAAISRDFNLSSTLLKFKEKSNEISLNDLLSTVVSKFEDLKQSLVEVNKSYKDNCNELGLITYDDALRLIYTFMSAVSGSSSQSNMPIDGILIDTKQPIDFKVFLSTLVISVPQYHVMLQSNDSDLSEETKHRYQSLLENLGLIVLMYIIFDPALMGSIEKKNLDGLLTETSALALGYEFSLFQNLFNKKFWYDQKWDNDCTLSFSEFTSTFYALVVATEPKPVNFNSSQAENGSIPRLAYCPSMSTEAFKQALSAALARKKLEEASITHKITFDRILLKFDQMHTVLKSTRRAFDTFADFNGTLSREALNDAIKNVHHGVSAEVINQIFMLCDVDASSAIEFKEFLTALTVAMLMHELPHELDSSDCSFLDYKHLHEMLHLMVSCYLLFDIEGKGYITKEVVEDMLLEHQKNTKGANSMLTQKMLSEQRWGEMDWDKNGNVDFAEFICTFAGWAIDIDTTIKSEKGLKNRNQSLLLMHLDIKNALRKRKAIDNQLENNRKWSIEKIIMRFKKMNEAFKSTETAFTTYAKDGSLSRENLVLAIQSIHRDASEARILEIFDLSDLDSSMSIEFEEFITALTIALTLNELPPSPNVDDSSLHKYNELTEVLGLICSAYLLYDPNVEGQFSKNVYQSSGDGWYLSNDRWNELDWDGNGCVDFPEFARTFVGWIRDVGEEEFEFDEGDKKKEGESNGIGEKTEVAALKTGEASSPLVGE